MTVKQLRQALKVCLFNDYDAVIDIPGYPRGSSIKDVVIDIPGHRVYIEPEAL